MGEKILFFKQFIENPRQIGSITPSSNKLSNKMIEQIDFKKARYVIELGPGTGSYTRKNLIKEKRRNKIYCF